MIAPSPTVEDLRLHDHACWVVSSRSEDHRSQLVGYLRSGLDQGQRVVFLGAPADRAGTVAADLAAAGLPVDDLVSRGQLVLASAEDEYLSAGSFDPRRRLDGYVTAVHEAVDAGYQGLRIAADIAWLPGRTADKQLWPGYEMGAGLLAAQLPVTALCIYDADQWQSHDLAVLGAVHSSSIHDSAATDTVLRLHARPDGSVDLRGELDATYASQVQRILTDNVVRRLCTALNLADLRFADVAGMRTIVNVGHQLALVHGQAAIHGASPVLRRLWQLAAFDVAEPTIVME